MDKVAIYCRLSDEDKDKNSEIDESESIQNQKTLLTKYAIEKGWNIYKIYSDDDYSGMDANRPEFSQMLHDAELGKFNIVLCKHQSRFSRDVEVVEKYLHRKFPEWRIRFISVTDNVDTRDKGNKKARQINSLVNEWYCEDISEAIRATFKIKREEGKFIGSFAPYGYVKNEYDNNKIVIDQEAARVVKMIFNWYLEGHGTQHIAYMLNEKEISNPTKYKQSKGFKYKNSSQTDDHGLWNKTTIRRMLRDETYRGYVVQGKREKVNYKSDVIQNKSKDKWIIVKDMHEPIIDYETFYAVQKRLNCNVRSTGKGRTHIFAGKVRCMDCKNSMNKVRSGNGYAYLRCKLYARGPKKQLCTSHSIRLDILQEIVVEKIRGHLQRVCTDTLIHRLNQEDLVGQSIKTLRKQLAEIEKQLKEKDNIVKSLYIDKVNNLIDNTQFQDLNSKFIYDKEVLIRRKRNLEEDIEDISDRIGNTERWIGIIQKYKGFKELTHSMVNELIDYIEIGEKDNNKIQKLTIHWKF
ncbi:MAG: recombinase family protein [Bacillota bacterium]